MMRKNIVKQTNNSSLVVVLGKPSFFVGAFLKHVGIGKVRRTEGRRQSLRCASVAGFAGGPQSCGLILFLGALNHAPPKRGGLAVLT